MHVKMKQTQSVWIEVVHKTGPLIEICQGRYIGGGGGFFSVMHVGIHTEKFNVMFQTESITHLSFWFTY